MSKTTWEGMSRKRPKSNNRIIPTFSFQHAFGLSLPLKDRSLFINESRDASTGQRDDLLIFSVGKHALTTSTRYLAVCDKISYTPITCTLSEKQNEVSLLSSKTKNNAKNGQCNSPEQVTSQIQVQNQAQITIFTLSNRQPIQTLLLPPMKGDCIFSVSFCGTDSKLLATTTIKNLCIWSWEKEVILFSFDINPTKSSTIFDSRTNKRCNISSNDNNLSFDDIIKIRTPVGKAALNFPIITTSGKCHFRLWSPSKNERDDSLVMMDLPKYWNQSAMVQNLKKEERYHFLDHVWLSDCASGGIIPSNQSKLHSQRWKHKPWTNRLVALCSSISLEKEMKRDKVKSNQFLQVFQVTLHEHRFHVEQHHIIPLHASENIGTFHFISRYGNMGCIITGDNGNITKCQGKIERGEFIFIKSTSLLCGMTELLSCASVAKEHENLVLLSSSARLLRLPVSCLITENETELLSNTKYMKDIHSGGFHRGSILDMHVAISQPFVVTCGTDRSVRVWNVENFTCEIVHHFNHEEPTCVSIHPSAFLIVVGLKVGLRMYNVLVSKLILFKEIQCKDCHQVQFCEGGHMFAAAFGSLVNVYATYALDSGTTFHLIRAFTGHIGQINTLVWCYHDTYLYTTGKDGNVYGWDVPNNTLVNDTNVLRRSSGFIDMVVDLTSDRESLSRVVVCSNDGLLMEVSWNEVKKEMQSFRKIMPKSPSHDRITAICLSQNRKVLFAGTAAGNLREYIWPLLEDDINFQEYDIHNKNPENVAGYEYSMNCPNGVTSLYADHDKLISTGEDGSIFVIGLNDQDMKKSFDSSFNKHVVLVSVEENDKAVEEKMELERKLEDMRREMEFSLHRKDVMWKGEMKELIKSTDEMVLSERERFQEVQKKHERTIDQHVKELENRDNVHSEEILSLKCQYDHKITMEINRSDELERSLRELEQKYRMSSKEEREANEKALRKNEQKMDKMETHLNSIIARLKDEAKQSEAVFKEILDQQEEEYEMELMKLVSETETKLYGEHCVTQKVRGVVQTIQSRQEQLSKKNKELKSKTDCFEQDYLKEKMKREEMEESCSKQKDMLKEFECQMLRKENRMKELETANHTLESYRFVLEDQVLDLKSRQDPMKNHLNVLTVQLEKEKQNRAEQLKKLSDYQLLLEKKKSNIQARGKEINAVKLKLRARERSLSAIKDELSTLIESNGSYHNVKGLEALIRQIYFKHVN